MISLSELGQPLETLEDPETWIMENIHADLQRQVIHDPHLGWMVHSPLVVEVLLVTGSIFQVNRRYEHRLAQIQSEPVHHAILLYERPYRLHTLIEWLNLGMLDVTTGIASETLARVWVDMEGDDSIEEPLIESVVRWWRKLGYYSDRCLPRERLEVYRGGADPMGIAWTTDIGIAQWFAGRFGASDPIWRSEAPEDAVLARLNQRNESEVTVDPRLLENVRLVV